MKRNSKEIVQRTYMAIIRAPPIESDCITRICVSHLGCNRCIRTTGQGGIGSTIVWIWAADFPNDAWIIVLERIVAVVCLSVDSNGAQETVCRYYT